MPYQTHTEDYFITESISDKRTQTGFRIEEVRYYCVIEENIYIDHKKIIKGGFTSSWAAKQYSDGWNDCLNALSAERQSA